MLELLYQGPDFVIIDKPSGLLVHPTPWSPDRDTCLSRLRDQLGEYVYPVHRLDRGASGALAFARTPQAARAWRELYDRGGVKKVYWIVVRGFVPESGEIDREIRDERGVKRSALTRFARLGQVEHAIPVGPYETSRYSWVEVQTETGRFHQIRQHFAGISHPVLGDTERGDGAHNRSIRTHFGIHRLLLFCTSLEFRGEFAGKLAGIRAETRRPSELDRLGFGK